MDVKKLVYTVQSKQHFYCRDAVCEFVFQQGAVPLNPFRVFDYFLGDRVDRDDVRAGNRRVLEACDEVWVFGDTLSNGAVVELALAARWNKPLRFFTIETRAQDIHAVEPSDLEVELEILHQTGLDRDLVLKKLVGGEYDWLVEAMGRTRELNGSIPKSPALTVI